MNDIAIHAKELTKKFGNFIAVDHISLDIKRGEIFGFLGANGAGKTTAIRMFCGLSQPTSGEGTVAGYDISSQPEQIKRNIGYMSQKFSLYDDLTIKENLRLFGGIYGLSTSQINEKAENLLHNFQLYDKRNTLVRDIPLGWKQKLAFSTAMFHNPKIVFLDE